MKKLVFSFALLLAVGLGVLEVEHITRPSQIAHATTAVACAGGPCYTPPPTSTCVGGGTVPNPPNWSNSSVQGGNYGSGVLAYVDVPGLSGCLTAITNIDATMAYSGNAGVSLAVYQMPSSGGTCPTNLTNAIVLYLAEMETSTYSPYASHITDNDGVILTTNQYGRAMCITFNASPGSGAYQAINLTGFWE